MKRLLFALLLPACTDSAPIPEAKSNVPRDSFPTADLDATVTGNTQFAVDVYHQVAQGTDNVFFSPHSISEALGMTLAGARNNTAAQMTSVLHAGSDFHAGMDKLAIALASRGSAATDPFALQNADALWADQGMSFEQPFLDLLATDYGAGVYLQDFAHDPDGARDTINGWVEDQTNDKIQNLLQPGDITNATAFVLTNAIYFHASWQHKFDPANTHDGTFTTPTGGVSATLMTEEESMGYVHADTFDAVAMPYDGGGLELLVIQPTSLSAFEASMTAASLQQIATDAQPRSVTLTLPKFSITQRTSIKDTLTALGMTDAFDPAVADFSGVDGASDISISDVIHKAFISINEEGTEAAAATAVVAVGTAAPFDPVTLVIDHPFVFAIRDVSSGAILFMGRVTNPAN